MLACDSTTVNLYKLADAALDLRPGPVVVDEHDFPTDRYVLEGVAARRGVELRRLASDPVAGPQPDGVDAAAEGAALVVLSVVGYRSGALADVDAITAAVHGAGALMLWDVSHAAGIVPVDLAEAELAVGCTYKYLNAGPGAPAFLYVRRDLQERLRSPIQGWFGQREQFEMGPRYEPAAGIERFLAGTPPILGLAAVEAAVELVLEAGVEALRAKSLALTDLTVALHDERLAPLGFRLATPRVARPARRPRRRRPRRRLAALPRADRGRGRGARLPRARRDPARLPAALLPLRRRLGRSRPVSGPDRERPLPRRRRRAPARHVIRNAEPSDYARVIGVIDEWWGGRPMAAMLPKLFFVHFRDTSFVAEDDDGLAGFLCGFRSQTFQDEAYVHFVGVDPGRRGGGLGRELYERFFDAIAPRGTVRAVTSPRTSARSRSTGRSASRSRPSPRTTTGAAPRVRSSSGAAASRCDTPHRHRLVSPESPLRRKGLRCVASAQRSSLPSSPPRSGRPPPPRRAGTVGTTFPAGFP